MVVPAFMAKAPPTPLGGTLADGKWALTDYTVFTGPAGMPIPIGDLNWVSMVWMIDGTEIDEAVASQSEDQPDTPRATTYAVAVSGTSLVLNAVCPCSGSGQTPFTATDSELQLFVPTQGATVGLTLTKQ